MAHWLTRLALRGLRASTLRHYLTGLSQAHRLRRLDMERGRDCRGDNTAHHRNRELPDRSRCGALRPLPPHSPSPRTHHSRSSHLPEWQGTNRCVLHGSVPPSARDGILVRSPYITQAPCAPSWRGTTRYTSGYFCLPKSKTDRLAKGTVIRVVPNGSVTCPVKALQAISPNQSAYLFPDLRGRALTRRALAAAVTKALTAIGVQTSDFHGISYRAGATSLAAAGFSDARHHGVGQMGAQNSLPAIHAHVPTNREQASEGIRPTQHSRDHLNVLPLSLRTQRHIWGMERQECGEMLVVLGVKNIKPKSKAQHADRYPQD